MTQILASPMLETEIFRDSFNSSPIGIAVETLEGQPLFVNPAFCRMLGFSETELCKKHCQDFSPPEDAKIDWELFQKLRAGSIGHYQIEKRYFRSDGSLVWGRLSVSFLSGSSSPLVLAMIEDITEKKKAQDVLRQQSALLVEAQEKERARIARELHDDINQRLGLVAMGLDQLLAKPSEIEHRGLELQKQIDDISSDIQALAADLHPHRLEYLGVVAGFRSWIKEFAQRQNLEISFNADLRSSLPPEIGVTFFRILQEALQNTVKHSGGKRVQIELREDGEALYLVVRDSGKGFELGSASGAKGLGLTSMRERVRLVNGTINIDSKLNGGTAIEVRVARDAASPPNGYS